MIDLHNYCAVLSEGLNAVVVASELLTKHNKVIMIDVGKLIQDQSRNQEFRKYQKVFSSSRFKDKSVTNSNFAKK